MGIPKEESEQGIKNIFEEIMTKDLPSLVKENVTQVQEAQRVPNNLHPKRPISRNTIIKMAQLKDKDRILKDAREKQVVKYRGAPNRLSSDFSIETFQARREWHEIVKVMKSKAYNQGYFTWQGYYGKVKRTRRRRRRKRGKERGKRRSKDNKTEESSLTIKWH